MYCDFLDSCRSPHKIRKVLVRGSHAYIVHIIDYLVWWGENRLWVHIHLTSTSGKKKKVLSQVLFWCLLLAKLWLWGPLAGLSCRADIILNHLFYLWWGFSFQVWMIEKFRGALAVSFPLQFSTTLAFFCLCWDYVIVSNIHWFTWETLGVWLMRNWWKINLGENIKSLQWFLISGSLRSNSQSGFSSQMLLG